MRSRTAYVKELKAASLLSTDKTTPAESPASSFDHWQLLLLEAEDEKRPSVQFFKHSTKQPILTRVSACQMGGVHGFDDLAKRSAHWRCREWHLPTEQQVPWGLVTSASIEVSATPSSDGIFSLDPSPGSSRPAVDSGGAGHPCDAGAATPKAVELTPLSHAMLADSSLGLQKPDRAAEADASPISVMAASVWTPTPLEFSLSHVSDCSVARAKAMRSEEEPFSSHGALGETPPSATSAALESQRIPCKSRDAFESLAVAVYKLCGCSL